MVIRRVAEMRENAAEATRRQKMNEDQSALTLLANEFAKNFSNLENSMAELLHWVLFFRDPGTASRVAHAIYFSPDGFGQRQVIVNNALTEWLTEHPIGAHDFSPLWKRLNDRLTTLRRTRNLLAHGSVRALMIGNKDDIYVRLVPPTYSPKLGDLVKKGTIPGKSVEEMQQMNGGLTRVILCIQSMARAIEYHEEGEPTWKETYDALEFHLNELDNWFPDAQKTQ